jgi:hypothetical protein
MFFYPFLPLLNRDHNSDSMVYINCAWIARIKADSNSLNTRFPDAIFFLIANIILSSTCRMLSTNLCAIRYLNETGIGGNTGMVEAISENG